MLMRTRSVLLVGALLLAACDGGPPRAEASQRASAAAAPSAAAVATSPRSVAAPPSAPAPPSGAASAPSSALLEPRNDLPGLPNFARVSPVLYRGAQPTREGFLALREMGVKTVVSLRMLHSDRELLAGTGMRHLRIPAKAWHPEDEDVAMVLRIVREPENQPVFVHCEHGADRTGAVMAVYRMIEQRWSVDDAAAELPRFGYHPIWQQIMTYLRGLDVPRMRERIAATPLPALDVVP